MRRSRVIVGPVLMAGVLVAGCSSGTAIGSPAASASTAAASASMVLPGLATSSSTAATAPPAGMPPASMAALTATVVSSTNLAGFPGGPAVGSHTLWYWDDSIGRVSRLDTSTGQVGATLSLGDPASTPFGSPKTIVANGQIVWAADSLHHALDRIDPATNKVSTRIALDKVSAPGVTGPIDPLGLALDGADLWVSDFDQGLVLRVDTASGRVTTVVPGIDHPLGLAVGFGSVWVVEHRTGAIARIDPATATVDATINLPGRGPQPVCGMCVDNVLVSRDSVWVPLNFGRSVVRIDPVTNAVSAQVSLDRVDSLAIGSGEVWAAAWDGSIPCTDSKAYLARIDTATNRVSGMKVVACAESVAVADGDVWVGTADAPNGVTRLDVKP